MRLTYNEKTQIATLSYYNNSQNLTNTYNKQHIKQLLEMIDYLRSQNYEFINYNEHKPLYYYCEPLAVEQYAKLLVLYKTKLKSLPTLKNRYC